MRRSFAAATLIVALVAAPASAGLDSGRSIIDIVALQPDLDIESPTPASLDLTDAAGDIYHPLGEPGFTPDAIDITSVSVSTLWVDAGALEGFARAFENAPGDVLADRPPGLGLPTSWLAVTLTTAGTTAFQDPAFAVNYCEYLVSWHDPNFPDFAGIPGDLFGGTNRVAVARTGAGIDGPVQQRSLTFDGSGFNESDGRALFAASGMHVHFVIPLAELGDAGTTMADALTDGEAAEVMPIDMNFGAFCSRGLQTFVPEEGGADIVQEPLDLAAPPVFDIGQGGSAVTTQASTTQAPTTQAQTTATPTTAGATTSPSTTAATDGGGGSVLPLLLLIGGLAGGGLFLWWWWSNRSDDDPYRGFRYRLDIDGAPVGGFADIVGLEPEPGSIDYRSGSEPDTVSKMPGIPKNTNITLKRGITGDVIFWNWVLEGIDAAPKSGGIDLLDEKGSRVMRWEFERGWPSKWEGPALSPKLQEVPLESLELRVEDLRLR